MDFNVIIGYNHILKMTTIINRSFEICVNSFLS